VTDSAAENAGLTSVAAERRTLSLKGKSNPIDVFVFRSSLVLPPQV
jgi:hypothetical protein